MKSKIDLLPSGEVTVRQWHEEGLTYAQMAQRALEEHNVEISITAFSNLARRRGWPRRNARNDALIPWAIKPEHKNARPLVLLRMLSRRLEGLPLEGHESELAYFLGQLAENDAVVHYEPDTEEGFFYVPRQQGDEQYIRPPKTGLTSRRPR